MQFVQRKHQVSERRACRVLGQNRSTQRYEPERPQVNEPLLAELRRISRTHKSWGYDRAYRHLRKKGWHVNRKRVQKLWADNGLTASRPKRTSGKKALGGAENSIWNLPPLHPNHAWALDFIEPKLASGKSYRVLNVLDEYSRRRLGSVVAFSIGARRVQQELERLFRAYGKPGIIRTDNGREFIADLLAEWLIEKGVRPCAVEKASPYQNGYIESFHATMRRDLLNWEHYHSILEARAVIEKFCSVTYNDQHLHSSLGGLTPNEFMREYRAAKREGRPTPESKPRKPPVWAVAKGAAPAIDSRE